MSIHIGFGNNSGGIGSTNMGFFVKPGGTPAGDMTLLDFDGSTQGYLRFKLTSALHLVMEGSDLGWTATADISVVPLTVGAWHWVGAKWTAGSISNSYALKGQVWGPGGVTSGTVSQDSLNQGTSYGNYTYCTMGVGVSVSSGYLNFPATGSWAMGKLLVHPIAIHDDPLDLPLVADPSPSGLQVLYLGEQTTGAAATLTDSTTNANDGAAGPNGLVIEANGPFVV